MTVYRPHILYLLGPHEALENKFAVRPRAICSAVRESAGRIARCATGEYTGKIPDERKIFWNREKVVTFAMQMI